MGRFKHASGPILRGLIVLAMLAVWEGLARAGLISSFFFSSPAEVGGVLLDWFREGRVFGNIALTLGEAAIGFLIGATLGTALAFLLAFMPRVAAVLDPFIGAFNAFPRLTLAPLFIVWFGFGMEPKIVLVATFVLFICYLSAMTGLREAPSEFLDRAKLWGASAPALMQTVYLPAAAAWIFTGLRSSIGFAFIGAVVGEYVSGDSGVGYLILEGQARLRIREVFAGLFVLLCAAVLINFVLQRLEQRFLRWRPEAGKQT
jgi:NitT/TauT family transport system permease protein